MLKLQEFENTSTFFNRFLGKMSAFYPISDIGFLDTVLEFEAYFCFQANINVMLKTCLNNKKYLEGN